MIDRRISSRPKPRAFFITGTGTDIGKTALSLALGAWALDKGLRAAYWKPVQCGSYPLRKDFLRGTTPRQPAEAAPPRGGDADFLRLRLPDLPVHTTFFFSAPASPHLAAEKEGRNPADIAWESRVEADAARFAECDLVLIEGAGGLAVPLNRQGLLLAHLLPALSNLFSLEIVAAAPPGLGMLSPLLLSRAFLQGLGFPLLHFVTVEISPKNPEEAGDRGSPRQEDGEGLLGKGLAAEIEADNVRFLSQQGLFFRGRLPYLDFLARGEAWTSEERREAGRPLMAGFEAIWEGGGFA